MTDMVAEPTYTILEVDFEEEDFLASRMSPKEFELLLREEIESWATRRGIREVETADAGFKIRLSIDEVNEGNRWLRYFIGFLGASKVTVSGQIIGPTGQKENFRHVLKTHIGLFGGSTKSILLSAAQAAGQRISKQMSGMPGGTSPAEGSIRPYFLILGAVMVGLSAIVAGGFSVWALGLPQGINSIKTAEVPFAAGIVCGMTLVWTLLLGVACSPSRILDHRSMLWLQEFSGTKSPTVMRVVLVLLAVLLLALTAGLIVSAAGF